MKTTYTLAALALAAACAAWAGVYYFDSFIIRTAEAKAQAVSAEEQQIDRAAQGKRVRSLAAETAEDRAAIERLIPTDIGKVVESVEQTAKIARVSATVREAVPEGAPQALPGGGVLQKIALVVEARGGFSDLARALELLEVMPLPAAVTKVDFEKSASANESTSVPWSMTLHLRVLTLVP